MDSIDIILNKIQADEEKRTNERFNKLKKLKENKNIIKISVFSKGSFIWEKFTPAAADRIVNRGIDIGLDDLMVDSWYVVMSSDGIYLLDEGEYKIKNAQESLKVLYNGNHEDCKNFIKV